MRPAKIFTLTALVILLALFAAPGAFSTSISSNCQSCQQQCDAAILPCRDVAREAYIRCGQQGGTEETCKRKRGDAYVQCTKEKGCERCVDFRTGLGYYCKCGNPWSGGGGRGGENIDPFYNPDPFDPTNEEDTSWYCELEPCFCQPDLPWCG